MSFERSLFGLFPLQLSVGMLLFLPLLRLMGVRFHRLIAGLCLSFLVLGAAVCLRTGDAPAPAVAARHVRPLPPPLLGPGPAGVLALTTIGLLVMYLASLARGWSAVTTPLLILLALAAAGLGGTYFAHCTPRDGPAWQTAMRFGSLVLGAATLGGVMMAMLVGHWYLVRHDLPRWPLRMMTISLLVILVLRGVVGSLGIPLFIGVEVDDMGRTAREAYLWANGMFLLPRYLIGIIAPLIFAIMAHLSVGLRTQSTTGILYAAIVAVFIGELMAGFLYLSTLVPV